MNEIKTTGRRATERPQAYCLYIIPKMPKVPDGTKSGKHLSISTKSNPKIDDFLSTSLKLLNGLYQPFR